MFCLFPCTACLFLLDIAVTVSGISPVAPGLSLSQPSNSSQDTLPSVQDLLNSSLPYPRPEYQTLEADPRVVCFGARYGYFDNPDSCARALESIPSTGSEVLSFGERSLGNFEVLLPQRFLSR